MSSVYFVLCESVPAFIKIGHTRDAESRFQSLGYWNPFPLRLLCAVPGGKEEELDLHYMFDSARERGEWFRDCSAIRTLIGEIEAGSYTIPPRPARLRKEGAAVAVSARAPAFTVGGSLEDSYESAEKRARALRLTETELREAAGLSITRYWRAKKGHVKRDARIKVIRELERALDRIEAERAAA